MKVLKLENRECGAVIPSYNDLTATEYEPNNLFYYEMKHHHRFSLFFNINNELVCFSVNNIGNRYFDFVTIESDFRCFFDEPFTEENYNKALEVIDELLLKGDNHNA